MSLPVNVSEHEMSLAEERVGPQGHETLHTEAGMQALASLQGSPQAEHFLLGTPPPGAGIGPLPSTPPPDDEGHAASPRGRLGRLARTLGLSPGRGAFQPRSHKEMVQ